MATFNSITGRTVRIEVKPEYRAGRSTIVVYVNGTELTQRQSEHHARLKALAFADKLASYGHNVCIIDHTLSLSRKAV